MLLPSDGEPQKTNTIGDTFAKKKSVESVQQVYRVIY